MATISLARGVPPPESLPLEEIADCARAAILGDGRTVLSYGAAAGYAPLRAWIAERHGVDPARVVITNGSLQAFAFLATHLVQPRTRVLVEAPTYDRPLKILSALGADVMAVPMDDHGLDLAALAAALEHGPSPAFLYTIPTFQNPSGRTLALDRRRRLLELARRHGVLVLEDDPYGEVWFDREPPPRLFELASGDGVALSSSFSKIVAPGLRVGYLVLPAEVAAAVEAVAADETISPVLPAQATVYEFLRRGHLDASLDRVRLLLRERRDAALTALERELAGAATWSRPDGGYFIWLELDGVDVAELAARAEEAGVTFVPGPEFYPAGRDGFQAARLAFSFVSPAEVDEGVRRLARAVETLAAARAPAAAAR